MARSRRLVLQYEADHRRKLENHLENEDYQDRISESVEMARGSLNALDTVRTLAEFGEWRLEHGWFVPFGDD